jgi:four helix bundle protein
VYVVVNVYVDVNVVVFVDVVVNVNVNVYVHVCLTRTSPAEHADTSSMFGFQRLDVYRASAQFLAVGSQLADRVPRGLGDLSDQFRRAALSVPLNIAEASGKFARDASRSYVIARGSALECAAILDAMEAIGTFAALDLKEPRELLERIVSMITRLIRP